MPQENETDREARLRELASKLFFTLTKEGSRFRMYRDADVSQLVWHDGLTLDEVEETLPGSFVAFTAADPVPRMGPHWLPRFLEAEVGMLVVETIAKIRRAFFKQGKPIKATCRKLGVSRKAVRKVIRLGATEFRYEWEDQPRPKIGRWRASLDQLLRTRQSRYVNV